MLGLVIIALLLCVPGTIRTQEVEDNNKGDCMERFVRWCDTMDYRGNAGLSIMSYMYHDESGQFNRVFCSTDSEGTNCTRNGSPWFECTPDHTLSYKGQPLTSDTSPDDVDDDICRSAKKAFDDLQLQNSVASFDNETLRAFQQGMDSFYQEMEALREQMRQLTRELFGGSFLGGGGFDRWPFAGGDASSNATDASRGRDDSNQLEGDE